MVSAGLGQIFVPSRTRITSPRCSASGKCWAGNQKRERCVHAASSLPSHFNNDLGVGCEPFTPSAKTGAGQMAALPLQKPKANRSIKTMEQDKLSPNRPPPVREHRLPSSRNAPPESPRYGSASGFLDVTISHAALVGAALRGRAGCSWRPITSLRGLSEGRRRLRIFRPFVSNAIRASQTREAAEQASDRNEALPAFGRTCEIKPTVWEDLQWRMS